MFNFEYVGPPQNQYSDEHLKILQKVNAEIWIKRFATIIPMRTKEEQFSDR